MPTYDYECQSCGATLEKFQPITARPLRRCPVCGKHRLRRLIGAGAGLIFKGSGFYSTDYRSDEYKRQAKADSGPAAPSTKGDEPARKDSSVKGPAGKHATKPKS